jgi:hypothetical protein
MKDKDLRIQELEEENKRLKKLLESRTLSNFVEKYLSTAEDFPIVTMAVTQVLVFGVDLILSLLFLRMLILSVPI